MLVLSFLSACVARGASLRHSGHHSTPERLLSHGSEEQGSSNSRDANDEDASGPPGETLVFTSPRISHIGLTHAPRPGSRDVDAMEGLAAMAAASKAASELRPGETLAPTRRPLIPTRRNHHHRKQ